MLLIDISNTRTKIALADQESIIQRAVIRTNSRSFAPLHDEVGKLTSTAPSLVVACSVVTERSEVLRNYFGPKLILIDSQTDLGIEIDYPHPEQIGADRLANAVATHNKVGSPSIAVDFGTAVTFDVLASPATYIGGIIAPGLEAMTTYLHERTALLPKLNLENPPPTAIGKSTHHAMLTGAIVGYRGLIREILDEVIDEIGVPNQVPVLATGGNAHLVCDQIKRIQEIDPHLTLEGLRLVGLRYL